VPEIPDLEAIAGFLRPRLAGNPVASVDARVPWLVRTGADGLATLVGHAFPALHRHGKFLLFATDDDRLLVVNPMLTGRFHWAEPAERRRPHTGLVLGFEDGHELRYSDQRRMGRWYLVAAGDLATVPQFVELGPDALALDEETFLARLRRHPGQIKSILTNQQVLAGIGNAYSDEILWAAGLHPHRRRSTMTEEDQRRLYRALRETLEWARPILEQEVAKRLYQENSEWRAHLRVHRRTGQPCPRCGHPIAGQVRGGSETNYCLHCQPLAL
jgi:formamidopyrimidine-DNA glycosylase